MKTSLFTLLLFGLFIDVAPAQNKTTACACCTTAHRQFSFWLGEWEAYSKDGKLQGTNRLVSLQDSCIMQENWTSNGGNYSGTSYNFYDPATGKWNQLWLDNQGGNLQLSGGIVDGKMVLTSAEVPDPSGKKTINRITWTPQNGEVRQQWETSTDKGATWTTVFDGYYRRKK